MENKLSKKEIKALAELASPKKDFASKYEREQHIKGFQYCAHLFQMLGWRANKTFYKRTKKELRPVKIKKQKAGNAQPYRATINKSAINL